MASFRKNLLGKNYCTTALLSFVDYAPHGDSQLMSADVAEKDCTLVCGNISMTCSWAIILLKRVQNNPKCFFIARYKMCTSGRKQTHSIIRHWWIINRQLEVPSHIQANSSITLYLNLFSAKEKVFTSLGKACLWSVGDIIILLVSSECASEKPSIMSV